MFITFSFQYTFRIKLSVPYSSAFIRIVSIRPRYSARKRVARRVVIRCYFFDVPEIVVFVEIRLVQRRVILANQAVDIVVGITDIFPADCPFSDIPVLIVLVFIRKVQPSEFHFRYERRFSVGANHRYRRFRFSASSARGAAAATAARTERRNVVLQQAVIDRIFPISALFVAVQFAEIFVFVRYDPLFSQSVQRVVHVLHFLSRRQVYLRQRRVRHSVAR